MLGYGLTVGAVAVAAFLAGTSIRNPASESIAHVDERIAVTADVTERAVTESSLGTGTVTAGRVAKIEAPTADGARYVTATGVKTGKKYRAPAFIGAVNDQPVFAVDFDIPLYRDLHLNDSGPDVRSLRRAFGLESEGKVTASLLDQIARLYHQAGYQMPGGKGPDRTIQARDFNDIGTTTFTASAVKQVGSPVTGEPLATLVTSPNVVRLRASVLDVETVEKGMKVTVTTPDKEMPGHIAQIGGFSEDDSGAGGYDVTVALASAKDAASLTPGSQVSVQRDADVAATKAVPLQAIHQDGSAAYVLLPAPRGQETPRRVPVTVTGQGEGYAAIEADGLSVGDRVLIAN